MLNLICRKLTALFSLLFILSACAPVISPFSEQAYENATRLKAESLALIAKSEQPYATQRDAVEALLVDVDAAYEYANGLPKNDVVSTQWDVLRDPGGNLLGGFAERWRNSGALSPFLIEEIRMQVGAAFDTIICVEINKRDASVCEN